ncbi:uncharacterized protein CLAFUR5_05819 [Fulvia fulva]|uniref:N-acetylgalactosaminide beta-1,3-galactosyltransferase n=1 Tax=Passalora fulva TaxID=5499 RepID=A0A9Q8P9D5_PASFU|nr:uncharacterized protein CLAFUR5_05819 [Fulvia fulva]KAK4625662.1 hypothetical protein CLAFUR0_05680 [Fulvia fulva]UJO18180.1 hypothetical protein CLAFUR5_05819 [Fulvia fulva]
MGNKRFSPIILLASASLTALMIVWTLTHPHMLKVGPHTISTYPKTLPCKQPPGAEHIVVVIRTGSTEIESRLPVHFRTSMRCFPHYMIFSDHEEYFEDNQIHDALESVSSSIRTQHPDFEMHRRLIKYGRQALSTAELHDLNDTQTSHTGKIENPGWKLDKWKFLPMVNRTLHDHPDKRWFVFMEADTYLLWFSVLQYVAALDHTKPYYIGSSAQIGEDPFAHGGSGFIVSQPAMRLVVDHYAAHKADIEASTDGHWAGDCVLGKTFNDAGVPLTWGWPIFQGEIPGKVPYSSPADHPGIYTDKRVWCYPALSYHHVTPQLITDMWQFEQTWLKSHNASFLHHHNVFADFIVPRMVGPQVDWDNESDEDVRIVGSLNECRLKCISNEECKQYSVDSAKRCRTRIDPALGEASAGISSGWVHHRVLEWQEDMRQCDNESWLGIW